MLREPRGYPGTAGDETTRLKRELVTYDAIAGELELYVRIPSLSSVADTELYVYYGNAGAEETDDTGTWNADYGVVYHLKEDPTSTAPQAKDSTANAVHEAWVNTLSWPSRAVVCRRTAATSSTTTPAASPGTCSGPTTGCSTTSRARSATGLGLHRRHLRPERRAEQPAPLVEWCREGRGDREWRPPGRQRRHGHRRGDQRCLFDGLIDEIRISTVVRSGAWLKATWRNLSMPASFLSSGGEETEGGGAAAPPRRPVIVTLVG